MEVRLEGVVAFVARLAERPRLQRAVDGVAERVAARPVDVPRAIVVRYSARRPPQRPCIPLDIG